MAGWITEAKLEAFPDRTVWVARVRNQSALPIRDVRITVPTAPDWEPKFIFNDGHAVVIPPKSDHDEAPRTDESTFYSVSDLRIEFSFTDAAGVRWHRDVAGRLSEVPSEPVKGPRGSLAWVDRLRGRMTPP